MDYAEIGELMLDKFQEQDLMGSVEHLESALECIDYEIFYDENLPKVIEHIKKAIADIKNVNPTLFNYPRVARYMEEGEIRGEISRKHIEKLNKEKKNADT